MNKWTGMGRITKDLDLKYSANNKVYLKFTIAVNGYKKDDVSFINCIAWDKTAENITKFFSKGRLIIVCGQIKTGSYENKEGQKVYTTDIAVNEFHFTGEKKDDSSIMQGFTDVTDEEGEKPLPF